MARFVLLLSILCLCRCLFAGYPATTPTALTSAKAAILLDRETGMVLWSKNADVPLPMASTTKIMTAIVILDHGEDKLKQAVTISKRAASVGGNWVLTAGDTMTLLDMLKAVLICSSNQASAACAEYLTGGHPEVFIRWMNETADEILGPNNHTNFVNPHGLYDNVIGDRHYTSARDLALITRHALKNYPLIRQIVAEGSPRQREPIDTYPRGKLYLENHNRILDKEVPGIPGARIDGVKTGYVLKAGKCLVSSATLNDWQLIAVVLGGDAHYFQESANLLHYGFSRYRWMTYAGERQPALTRPVSRGKIRGVSLGVAGVLGAPIPSANNQQPVPRDRVAFEGPPLTAPIRRGQQVGEFVLLRNEQEVSRVPAIALDDVPLAWWTGIAKVGLYTVVTILGMYLLGKIYGTITKSRRRRRRHFQAQSRGIDPDGTYNRQR